MEISFCDVCVCDIVHHLHCNVTWKQCETFGKDNVKSLISLITFIGCYGVKPDSVTDSWLCSRCTEGAWTVVSDGTTHAQSPSINFRKSQHPFLLV